MTTVSDQLMEYGGVPVGAGRLAKLFQKDNIFFVDGDHGQAGWSAKTPRKAVALPSQAVSLAAKEGIIYIRPKTSATNEDVYYEDNIEIPIAKPHIQLIGAGAGTVPGYRGAAQIRPLVATTNLILIHSSGVCVENLHINNTGGGGSMAALRCWRWPTYPGAVAPQIRHCRFISDVALSYALTLESAQYCVVEDNIFLDCNIGIYMTATHGSPQGYTIRRNIFSGLVAKRHVDIAINMTDINSHGHTIDSNLFIDGLPTKAGEFTAGFLFDTLAATSAATGIISNNFFSDTSAIASVDGFGKTGASGIIGEFWFFVGNYNEIGLIPRKD